MLSSVENQCFDHYIFFCLFVCFFRKRDKGHIKDNTDVLCLTGHRVTKEVASIAKRSTIYPQLSYSLPHFLSEGGNLPRASTELHFPDVCLQGQNWMSTWLSTQTQTNLTKLL